MAARAQLAGVLTTSEARGPQQPLNVVGAPISEFVVRALRRAGSKYKDYELPATADDGRPLAATFAVAGSMSKLLQTREELEDAAVVCTIIHRRPLAVVRLAADPGNVCLSLISAVDIATDADGEPLFFPITSRAPPTGPRMERFFCCFEAGTPLFGVTDPDDPRACTQPDPREPFRGLVAPAGMPAECKLHPAELVSYIAAGLAYLAVNFPGAKKRLPVNKLVEKFVLEQRVVAAAILPWLAAKVTGHIAGTETEKLRELAGCPRAAWAMAFDNFKTLDEEADFGIAGAADAAMVIQAMGADVEVHEVALQEAAALLQSALTAGTKEVIAARQSATAARTSEAHAASAAKAPAAPKLSKKLAVKPVKPPVTKPAPQPVAKPASQLAPALPKPAPAAPAAAGAKRKSAPAASTEGNEPEREMVAAAVQRPRLAFAGLPSVPRKAPTPVLDGDARRAAPMTASARGPAAQSQLWQPTPSSRQAFSAGMGGGEWQPAAWSDLADDPIEEDEEEEEPGCYEPALGQALPNCDWQQWGPARTSSAPPSAQTAWPGAASSAPAFTLLPAPAAYAFSVNPVLDVVRQQQGLPMAQPASEQLRLATDNVAAAYQQVARCYKHGHVGTQAAPADTPAAGNWARAGMALGIELLDAVGSATVLQLQQALGSPAYVGLLALLSEKDAVLQQLQAAGVSPALCGRIATMFANAEGAHLALRTASRSIVALRTLGFPAAVRTLDIDRAAASSELLRSASSLESLVPASLGYGQAGTLTWQRLEGSKDSLKDSRRALSTSTVTSAADFVSASSAAPVQPAYTPAPLPYGHPALYGPPPAAYGAWAQPFRPQGAGGNFRRRQGGGPRGGSGQQHGGGGQPQGGGSQQHGSGSSRGGPPGQSTGASAPRGG